MTILTKRIIEQFILSIAILTLFLYFLHSSIPYFILGFLVALNIFIQRVLHTEEKITKLMYGLTAIFDWIFWPYTILTSIVIAFNHEKAS